MGIDINYMVMESMAPAPGARVPRDVIRHTQFCYTTPHSLRLYRPLYTAFQDNPASAQLFIISDDFDSLTPDQAHSLLFRAVQLRTQKGVDKVSVLNVRDILTIVRRLIQVDEPMALKFVLTARVADMDGQIQSEASSAKLEDFLAFIHAMLDSPQAHSFTTTLQLDMAPA